MLKLTYFILVIFLTGCATWNPFVPSGNYVDYDVCSSEPVTSKAMYRATMKPYTVRGIKYYPIIPHVGQTFKGTASWYGPDFHGGKTSNGEYYDMHDLTAAHKTLPMNTMVRVTNLSNSLSTVVRINDRGPFINNRIIDLSYQAAQDIGMIKNGTAKVMLEVIDYDTIADQYKTYKPFSQAKNKISQIKSKPTPIIKPVQKVTTKTTNNFNSYYKIQILSSTNKQKAKQFAQKYATIDDKYHTSVKSRNISGKTLYRVLIGDFKDKKVAQSFMLNNGLNGAFLIRD